MFAGQKIIETRNGSNQMTAQFIHGTQYIDELVMVRVAKKGDLDVHQDANWNVVGLTDLGVRLVERYVYSPYGELIVHQSTGYGDYDGDGDVDTDDRNLIAGACAGSSPGGACRILDINFDNTVDSSDTTLFDALPSGLQRTPGRIASGVDQPFGHQGLLFEPEVSNYQNRMREYDPKSNRFAQRDPLPFLAEFDPMLQYAFGMNVYEPYLSSPLNVQDPGGTAPAAICCTVGFLRCKSATGGCGGKCFTSMLKCFGGGNNKCRRFDGVCGFSVCNDPLLGIFAEGCAN